MGSILLQVQQMYTFYKLQILLLLLAFFPNEAHMRLKASPENQFPAKSHAIRRSYFCLCLTSFLNRKKGRILVGKMRGPNKYLITFGTKLRLIKLGNNNFSSNICLHLS